MFDTEQRMVFGATTFRETAQIMSSGIDPNTLDEWNVRTMQMPATVISSTLQDTLGWPDANIVSGDAVDIVTRLKEESDIPLRLAGQLVAELGFDVALAWSIPRAGDDLSRHLRTDRPPARSSEARATSTWNCSRAGRSTGARRNSSTVQPPDDGVPPAAPCGTAASAHCRRHERAPVPVERVGQRRYEVWRSPPSRGPRARPHERVDLGVSVSDLSPESRRRDVRCHTRALFREPPHLQQRRSRPARKVTRPSS